MRRFVALTFAVFAVSSATAQAAEPPGSLTQPPPPQACFDNDGADGCTAFVAPNRINEGFSGLAFAPDGKQLFTTAQGGGGVTLLRDAATGDLSTQPVPQGLAPFSSLAVAPDGRHVFYGARKRSRAGGVTVMKRNASTGFLEGAPASCFEDLSDPIGSCGQAPGLKDVEGVAVSPDGKTLYAAASQGGPSDGGALTAYEVGPNGEMTQIDCRPTVNANAGLCSNASGDVAALEGVDDVEVSPDGRYVYGVSRGANAIVGFNRFTSGANTGKLGAVSNCHARNAINKNGLCPATPGISSPNGLAISPDGADVYVASFNGGLAQMRRNTLTGALTPNGCFGDDDGCTADAVAQEGYREVVVTPDGNTVYAIGGFGPAGYVKGYSRDAQTGKLTPIDCMSDAPLDGCELAAGLKNASTAAVSLDGRDLYVGSFNTPGRAGAVARFAITQRSEAQPPVEAPAETAPTAPSGPAGGAQPTAPTAPADSVPTLKLSGLKGRLKASKLKAISGTAADDRGVARVQVALVKPGGGAKVTAARKSCRVLGSNGKLKSARAKGGKCEATSFLTAKGTTEWSLKLKKRLPRGNYVVFARATDSSGQNGKVVRRAITVR